MRKGALAAGLLAAVVTLAAAYVQVGAVAGELAGRRGTPVVVAHRAGAALGPENTLQALEASIAAGADMVEVDVRLTRDGVPVLLHDSTLRRTAGVERPVRELTLEELGKIDASVPTLDSFLKAAKGRVPVMVEVKTGDREEELLRGVIRLIYANAMERDCVVACGRLAPLERCRALAPELERVYITRMVYPGLGRVASAQGYSLDFRRANGAAVVQARAEGRGLYVWTVNDREDLRRMAALGPDGIITDNPALARALLDGAG